MSARTNKRCCSHCKQPDHTVLTCPKAVTDGEKTHLHIKNIVYNNNAPLVKDNLLFYLNLITVHDLSILMLFIANKFKPFTLLLIERNKITPDEALFKLKKHRIKALVWYYWFSTRKYREYFKSKSLPNTHKLDILAKSFECETDLTPFECPICVDCKPGKERTVSNCNHEVCKTCISQYFAHQLTNNFPKPRCSLCRTEITTMTFADTDYLDEVSNQYFKVHVLI